jgi:hypothetical protein
MISIGGGPARNVAAGFSPRFFVLTHPEGCGYIGFMDFKPLPKFELRASNFSMEDA